MPSTTKRVNESNDNKNVDENEVVKHKLNKLTVKANLNFNVNLFKKWMKQKLQDDGKMIEKKSSEDEDQNGEKIMHIPNLNLSHVAMTAMNEKLCQLILEKAIERIQKGKGGIYNIKYIDISDAMKIDPELRRNFYSFLDVFDNTLSYKDQYCIDEKCIKNYIDNVFGEHIDINNDAFNLLIYILLKSCVRILDSAFIMMNFAKKRSLSSNVILSCINIHFSGIMEHLLRMRVEEAVKSCGRDDNKDDDENAKEDKDDKIEKEEDDNKEKEDVKEQPNEISVQPEQHEIEHSIQNNEMTVTNEKVTKKGNKK